jgi:monovalent cation/hydrogen antiporter
MLNTFSLCLFLAFVILFLGMVAKKLKIAPPIILVVGGLLLSLVKQIPAISIDPELIFIIFLPPLLYEAAWYTSWKTLWRWRRVVGSFAFLIVLLTSLVVAIVSSHLIPGFSLALGFLLGGIVSPPDAVSASSILKEVNVPRRMTSIVEGESLLNDASSLIVFRFALIAVETGRFAWSEAALNFFLVIIMGIVAGLAIGLIYYLLHTKLPTSANMDIILTLTAPYVMYITAEYFHWSGVLAVVSGGLYLSAKSHVILSHRSRIQGAGVWASVVFLLNGVVFLLIGLELPLITSQLGEVSLSRAIGYGLVISAVLIIARLASTFGASVFTMFISRYIKTEDSRPGWKAPLIFGWAGMRGVVSLAAALSIPLHLPQRNLILFITFMVILVTLVVQGLTLPALIRWVKMEDPDNYLAPEEEDRKIRKMLSDTTLKYLDDNHRDVIRDSPWLAGLREKYSSHKFIGDDENDQEGKFGEVYMKVLEEQRKALHEMNKDRDSNEEVIRKYLVLLDLEEERYRLKNE